MTHFENAITFLTANKIPHKVLSDGKKDYKKIQLKNPKLTFSGFDFGINPLQDSNKFELYFKDTGEWYGGSPIIWNTPKFNLMIHGNKEGKD